MVECPACVAHHASPEGVFEAPLLACFDMTDGTHEKCVLCGAKVWESEHFYKPGTVRTVIAAAWRLGGMAGAFEMIDPRAQAYGRVADYLYALEDAEARAEADAA